MIVLAGAMPATEDLGGGIRRRHRRWCGWCAGDVRAAVERVRAMGLPGWAVLPADAGRDELGQPSEERGGPGGDAGRPGRSTPGRCPLRIQMVASMTCSRRL